ncbi:programmed cell death protein 7 isoform X1 [Archocentrus centrarchus]|uniref:programmed cell death protein 7 isoform X1 n=1 Tax=Archocentrus centrarchus TaxID=63155 RepID=UPI0011E9F5BD|nr:programmed cell death protein 7 isoform X1 [Archocentrus centrarchus]
MDSTYGSDIKPSACSGGYLHTELTAPPWTPPPTYDGHSYGAGFGRSRFVQPYGFDPSVPPPGFGCPPPGHFLSVAPPASVNDYSSAGAPACQPPRPHAPRCDREPALDFSRWQHEGLRPAGTGLAPQPDDDAARQRRRDAQWITRFLQTRGRSSRRAQSPQQQPQLSSIPALRDALYGAAELVSRLEEICHTLNHNLHNDSVWSDHYLRALRVKVELQDKVNLLRDSECLDQLKTKVSRAARRRVRRLRARKEAQIEEQHAEERRSQKEAAIDKWRMKLMQEVEEKKKEQDLKLAADSVLCEVRKKQADVKRMQDILRSLEKLRRLRKEAVSKKGIVTELQSDEVFSGRLEQLRTVMKKRTAVYSAEEKALMVMLEGEQEEERRREQERRARKERERQLQRKHRVDSMLFGEEFPADCALQPFRDYYSQAEHSLHALIQIRKEWDTFLVAADHPDSSSVPQSWILPDPPSDQAWASALQTADTDCDSL